MPGLSAGSCLGAFALGGERLLGEETQVLGSFWKAVVVGSRLRGHGLCRSCSPVPSSQAAAKALVGCEAGAVRAEPGSGDSARAAAGEGVCS